MNTTDPEDDIVEQSAPEAPAPELVPEDTAPAAEQPDVTPAGEDPSVDGSAETPEPGTGLEAAPEAIADLDKGADVEAAEEPVVTDEEPKRTPQEEAALAQAKLDADKILDVVTRLEAAVDSHVGFEGDVKASITSDGLAVQAVIAIKTPTHVAHTVYARIPHAHGANEHRNTTGNETVVRGHILTVTVDIVHDVINDIVAELEKQKAAAEKAKVTE